MGTNYYIKLEYCPTCDRYSEELHLGKSSGGWKFLLQSNPEYYPDDWKEMKKWVIKANGIIFDEYERELTKEDFIQKVENWQDGETHDDYYCFTIDKNGYNFCKVDFS